MKRNTLLLTLVLGVFFYTYQAVAQQTASISQSEAERIEMALQQFEKEMMEMHDEVHEDDHAEKKGFLKEDCEKFSHKVKDLSSEKSKTKFMDSHSEMIAHEKAILAKEQTLKLKNAKLVREKDEKTLSKDQIAQKEAKIEKSKMKIEKQKEKLIAKHDKMHAMLNDKSDN